MIFGISSLFIVEWAFKYSDSSQCSFLSAYLNENIFAFFCYGWQNGSLFEQKWCDSKWTRLDHGVKWFKTLSAVHMRKNSFIFFMIWMEINHNTMLHHSPAWFYKIVKLWLIWTWQISLAKFSALINSTRSFDETGTTPDFRVLLLVGHLAQSTLIKNF